MNREEIDKWLDNEYGVSYTKLEELHDFYFEKYCDLKKENQELKKIVELYSNSLYNSELAKHKEVIDKIFNYLEDNYGYSCVKGIINDTDVSKLYDILKEVE